jgi:endonuclease/exonuclease/phosphatase family metal-dependent hydrolase
MTYVHTTRRVTASLAALLLCALLLPASPQAKEETPLKLDLEVNHLAPAPAEPPGRLRIISFNVHYAPDVSALAESIRQAPTLKDADVLLLQEIESYPSEGASRTRKLAEALGLNYVYAPARLTKDGDGTHGLAILSPYPLRDAEILPLPRFDLGYRTRRRIAVAATVDVAGRPLRVYNLHLDTRINTQDRLTQLQPVLEAATNHEVATTVIGGDFNTNPLRWLFHRVPIFRSNQAAAVDDLMRENGFSTPLTGTGATINRKLFKARVDSIYTRGLVESSAGVAREVRSSDHFPVWVEVAWPTHGTQPEEE